MERELRWHLNVGGPRGWTTACGIESASFVRDDEVEEVDCRRCQQTPAYKEARNAE